MSLKSCLHFTSSIIWSNTKLSSFYKLWFPYDCIFIALCVSSTQRFPSSGFNSGVFFVEQHISICHRNGQRFSIFLIDAETLLLVCENTFSQTKYILSLHHLLDDTIRYVHVFHWNHLTKLCQRVDVLYFTTELRAETQKQHMSIDFPPKFD